MSDPALHAGSASPAAMPCTHCGRMDVVAGIKLNQRAEIGAIGLPYKTGFLVVGTEPLCADLCRVCGTVLRLYVKETGRKWIQD